MLSVGCHFSAPFDRITEINFNIDADEDSPSAALFEACCGDHIQPFDDDEDDDIWEDQDTRCAAQVTARARFGGPHASENGLARGGRDGEEADAGAARVAASPAAAQKEVPRVDSGSEGRCLGASVQAVQGTRVMGRLEIWPGSGRGSHGPDAH